jgi:uncharacterized protein
MEKNNLFIRINYKAEGNYSELVRDEELKNYTNNNPNKYLICRGVCNKNGGTIIFKARDFKEAEEMLNNNPLTKSAIHKLLIDVI